MPPFLDFEPIQSDFIIVIHPGSLYLRIGRASDVSPLKIIHAIARKRRIKGLEHQDGLLPLCASKTKTSLQDVEESRLQVSHTLQSCIQSDGTRRYATPPQQIAAFNRRSQPEEVSDVRNPDNQPDKDVIIGDEVATLHPDCGYNVHFPIKNGEFNIHSGVGGSVSSIIADMETIWLHAMTNFLNIEQKQLCKFKAVLVIPDIHHRGHIRELTSLLLNNLGFNSCFLVQDHSAATFGAGLPYACVVDVGDQKTSISCVEDCISQPNTRIRLPYGGAHVTQTLFWLLQKCAFPYKECSDRLPRDAMLLQRLKEEFCHVNLDICGSQEKSFIVNNPNETSKKYILQLGDECIVAPLSYFNTELLGVTSPCGIRTQASFPQTDPEDCFDAEYLRETGRKGTKDNNDPVTGDMQGEIAAGERDDDIVVDCGLDGEKEAKLSDKDFQVLPGQILSLDQAILQSIDRCPEELKRKMYSCILVVGGGMKFRGIDNWLQNRLSLQVPFAYRSDQIDIITRAKDMDPEITAWKGAAVMSCLESSPELWLSQSDWKSFGLRALREKALFSC